MFAYPGHKFIVETYVVVWSLRKHAHVIYEGGSESSVIGVITLLIDMIDCCIIP